MCVSASVYQKKTSVFLLLLFIDKMLQTLYCAWYKFISGFTWGLQNKIACESTAFLQVQVDRKDSEN